MLIQHIIEELQGIPPEQLTEVYNLIHNFKLGLNQASTQARQPGLVSGKLGNAFFKPLPEEELQQ
jgi:hypothetical protein